MSAELIFSDDRKDFRVVHGDWQTPLELSLQICTLIKQNFTPDIIIEPNCGLGSFIKAAGQVFSQTRKIFGFDIIEDYLHSIPLQKGLSLKQADFFEGLWRNVIIDNSDKKFLIIGNPPWVTNSELMRRNSTNVPNKRNAENLSGIEAITGKSNFDISQWMIQEELSQLQGCNAVLAMLCKTSTARKVIQYAWKQGLRFTQAQIRRFNANYYFDVSVDACLLMVQLDSDSEKNQPCYCFPSLDSIAPEEKLGIREGVLGDQH